MLNDLDYQIIKYTYDFMNENCVGPQRAAYIFQTIKSKFNNNGLTYSYFIALFENNEILRKPFVKSILDRYDVNDTNNVVQEEKTEITNAERIVSKENKNYLVKALERQRNKKDDLPDEYYYYCTKSVRFLKSDVVFAIAKLFEEKKENYVSISEIYSYLQRVFKVNSFNRGNLCYFLGSDRNVPKIKIEQLLLEYPKLENDNNSQSFDLSDFFLKNRNKLIKIVETVGIEIIKFIIKNGVRSVLQVSEAFENEFGELDKKIELKDENEHKLFNEKETDLLLRFLNLFSEEDFLVALKNEEYIKMYLDMFLEDENKKIEQEKFITQLSENFDLIEPANLNAKSKYIFPFELVTFFNKEMVKYLKELKNIDKNKYIELYPFKDVAINFSKVLRQSLPKYLNERFKFVLQRVNASYVPNTQWEKYVEVMMYREQGLNLEATSKYFDTSRERIRQIENKYLTLFNDLYNSQNGTLTRLIRAFSNNDYYMTIDDIGSIISFYPQLFVYLLKNIEVDDLLYIEELNVFEFIDEIDWYKELLVVADNLPDIISEEEIKTKIKAIYDDLQQKNIDIPYEYCEKIIKNDFKQIGTQYTRHNISLTTKYKKVMQKYFPEGIYIYSSDDLAKFREGYKTIFNDGKMPVNDRALYGRITAICYLKGKGYYALKKDKDSYISKELGDKIFNYIMESEREIFLTNTLFALFEDDLKAEGINNKYHLQGVIKEVFGDKLFLSRDYVSKTNDKSSIYSDIYDYVKQIGRPVTIEEIKNEFVGVSDIVFSIALTNDNILNLRKSYIHTDNIHFDNNDIEILRGIISRMVADGQIHHSNDIFGILDFKYKSILEKYDIDNQFKLFSYISHLFADEFEFQRPFFAQKDVKIGYQRERIIEYVRNFEEVSIRDLLDFVYSNKLHLYSIVEFFFNDMKEEYLIKDKTSAISLERSKVNKYNAMAAENVLLNAMGEDLFIVASKFDGYRFLSNEVKWTDWLLASAMNLYSTKIKIIATDSKLRSAEPIFVKQEVKATNVDELKDYLKSKSKLNDLDFIKYLNSKGL